MNIICFHNPEEENGYLSNWYLSEFTVDNIKFSSMEQFMMYKKAICFGDKVIAGQILKTNNVTEIKKLGRLVAGYCDNVWAGIRQIIVYEGIIEKFSQNKSLGNRLKKTKDAIFAECAVKDYVWGIGLSMTDDQRLDMSKWKGANLLGYTLMMVRDSGRI